jgi:hypothetical protein
MQRKFGHPPQRQAGLDGNCLDLPVNQSPKGIIELRAGCDHDGHDLDPQAAAGPIDMIEKQR